MGRGIARIAAPVAALGLIVALSGCEIALTAASFAVTGVSYALTDKSPSDNALSVVADSDCALFRFIKGESICRDEPAPVQVASLAAIAPSAGYAGVATADAPYRVHAGSALTVDRLVARNVELVGFASDEELYALMQDDGALEVFVHDPKVRIGGSNIRLVLRIERYATDPDAFQGLNYGGVFVRIRDIAV